MSEVNETQRIYIKITRRPKRKECRDIQSMEAVSANHIQTGKSL